MIEIATAKFTDFSFQLELDGAQMTQMHILTAIKHGMTYEPDTNFVYEKMRPYDCFVDVGAHVGWYSLLAAKCHETVKVWSFEPCVENMTRLLRNIELNKLQDRVFPFGHAVGSERKMVKFYINKDNDGGHGLWDQYAHPMHEKTREAPRECREVQMVKLVDYWPTPICGGRIILKVDAEGAETDVLSSIIGHPDVDPQPYIVIAEINPFALEQLGSSEKELRDVMLSHGYLSYGISSGVLIRIQSDEYVENPGLVYNQIFCKEPLI